MFYETDLIDNQDLRKITRITVVTDEGREFEKYNAFENGIVLSIQDDGRTLKIFPGQKREKPSNVVIKKGHADWADLKGRKITFDWTDGYEDFYPEMTFSHTQVYAEDPRYPRYYILDENDGGYSVWEDEEVEVTILD